MTILGNLIKINIYAELKKEKRKQLKLDTLEKSILTYNEWLRNTNREDKIENYERFLQAQ